MSNDTWTPAPGERVLVEAVVEREADKWGDYPLAMPWNTAQGRMRGVWSICASALRPWTDRAPSPAPREPWEVLREAAQVALAAGRHYLCGRNNLLADKLEQEATTPQPRTLAEIAAAVAELDPALGDEMRRAMAAGGGA